MPARQLTIEVVPLPRLREGLESSAFDLGIGAFIETDPGTLRRERIGSGDLRLVLPPTHPLAAHETVAVDALREHDLNAYGRGGSHGRLLEGLLGLPPRQASIDVPYAYMACALVVSGQGLEVVDDLTLRHYQQAGVAMRPLRPSPHCGVDVLLDPVRAASLSAVRFIEALRTEWAGLQR